MDAWVFKDFVASNGTNHIKKWYRKELSIQQQADLERLIEMLSKKGHWGRPDYLRLSGKYQTLGEIRLKDRPPIRLVGFRREKTREFIFLIGCRHKDTYDPPNALDTALGRMRDLELNRGDVIDHDFNSYDQAEEE